jgi:hypothetical protein
MGMISMEGRMDIFGCERCVSNSGFAAMNRDGKQQAQLVCFSGFDQ